ncbi:MAG TPA: hypothetical protein VN736_13410 [Candidatus Limnocylindrales bacterium]|nr:hypothetical protein [Candidatus Limnocylindrales bacterium]
MIAGTDSNIFFDVRDNSAGQNVHLWDGGVEGTTSTTATSGTFSITRTAGTVSGYIDGNLIFSESRSADINAVGLVLENNSGSNDNIAVTFSNFSITADSVTATPETASAALLIGVAALFGAYRGKKPQAGRPAK